MKEKTETSFSKLSRICWDLWCTLSVVGLWPRFIEPKLISTTRLTLKIPKLPTNLTGLKILQFSDLHLHQKTSERFINKLIRKIQKCSPDLIVFTGDFVCYADLEDAKRLERLLCSLQAPYGCYAIFGNHDYQQYVSINNHGEYDTINSEVSALRKGWRRLFIHLEAKGITTLRASRIGLNTHLIEILKRTPFQVLHNKTQLLSIRGEHLNLSGLGEHMLGQCHPETAFSTYKEQYPGIVLSHNPDSITKLKQYPGDIILCGHTHGGQVNLPGLCHKFMVAENPHLKRGLYQIGKKQVYVNRGVGSAMAFRWFAMPELLLLTLERGA